MDFVMKGVWSPPCFRRSRLPFFRLDYFGSLALIFLNVLFLERMFELLRFLVSYCGSCS